MMIEQDKFQVMIIDKKKGYYHTKDDTVINNHKGEGVQSEFYWILALTSVKYESLKPTYQLP